MAYCNLFIRDFIRNFLLEYTILDEIIFWFMKILNNNFISIFKRLLIYAETGESRRINKKIILDVIVLGEIFFHSKRKLYFSDCFHNLVLVGKSMRTFPTYT